HALLRTPQNNLKMFRNGVLLDGNNLAQATNEALGEEDQFCTFIAAALLGDFSYHGTTMAATSVSRLSDKEGDTRQPCNFD
ncbi:inositol-pentakisphosphate 2-kinase, partial [Klebsiella pneumoniae]|nr:inositol-pentakisphosphate 2-kinase [Klebsiella pneumoniae]